MLTPGLISIISRSIQDYIRTHSLRRSGWQVASRDPRGRVRVHSLHPSYREAKSRVRELAPYCDGPVWIEDLRPLLRHRDS